jgi:hypothetical protein
MKTRILILILSIAFSGNALAKGSKRAHRKSAKPPVTIIDMSGAPEPESELPAITKKGSL